MRVLTVSEPGLDGVFRHVEALVHYLVEQGVEVDLAWSSKRTSDDLPALVEFVRDHGGATFDFKSGPEPSAHDAVALVRLWELAVRRSPDLIHAHSSKAGALVRILAPSLSGPKFLYTPHAYFGMGGDRRPGIRMAHAIESWLGPTCPTIHVSTDERDFGVRNFGLDPADCLVFEHGVDVDRFSPATAERRRQLRADLGIGDDDVVIGAIGRIGPQKDYPSLYRAAASSLRECDNLRMLRLGKGDKADVEAVDRLGHELAIDDRIVKVGFMAHTERFYQAVDLVVLASTYEAGIPYVALEALACGLPLVVTRCPGLRTIEEHPFDAISMADTGDPDSLSAAIRERLQAAMENNHRAVVLERFTQDHARQRVLETYSSTLGRHVKGNSDPS